MSSVVLDINDATLSLWQGEEPLVDSPGYALLDGRSYRFGESARSRARLHPQQINHRFWSQLSTEPLTPAFGPGRHSADLVHAHLEQIYAEANEPGQLLLAAPGNLQHDQLALLLGIIETCPFSATGLVDRATAAIAASTPASFNWHVELQLHQVLVTGLVCRDGKVHRQQVTPIPGSGWLAIQDALAGAIADAFIRQTRFDPRHQAATEQALYDELPQLLEALRDTPEYNLELGGHQARVEKALLAESCAAHYQRIRAALAGQTGALFLGDTLSGLPATEDYLGHSTPLGHSAVAAAVNLYREDITAPAEGVHFITSLPTGKATGKAPRQAAPEPAPKSLAPSHCQIDMQGAKITLRHLAGAPATVNGVSTAESVNLGSGDTISLHGGASWRLLAVPEKDDGP